MRPDLAAQLIQTQPTVLARPDHDDEQPAECYIECGDGWFDLIDQTAGEMAAWALAAGVTIYIFHAKEKFGALRLRWRTDDELSAEQIDQVRQIVEGAAEASESVCELCGKPGQLIVDRSARVRCRAHR